MIDRFLRFSCLVVLLAACSSEGGSEGSLNTASGNGTGGEEGDAGGGSGGSTLDGSSSGGDPGNATGGDATQGSGGRVDGAGGIVGTGGDGPVASGGSPGTGGGGPQEVRVLTFNMKRSLDASLETLAEVILSASPDVVGLQEVDKETTRSGSVNQPEVLANLTGMQWFFAPALHDFQGGQYGNAVLIAEHLHVVKAVAHDLDPVSGGGGEDRSAMELQLAFNEGTTQPDLVFINSHWEFSDTNARDAQATHINRIGASAEELPAPAIFVGDLNAHQGSGSIDILREFWTVSRENFFGIDWIVHRGERLEVGDVRNLDSSDHPQATTASDHLPVLATYTWRP